jgi:hypothetical protein
LGEGAVVGIAAMAATKSRFYPSLKGRNHDRRSLSRKAPPPLGKPLRPRSISP